MLPKRGASFLQDFERDNHGVKVETVVLIYSLIIIQYIVDNSLAA